MNNSLRYVPYSVGSLNKRSPGFKRLIAVVMLALAITSPAWAVPMLTDAFCDGNKCGEMRITTYEAKDGELDGKKSSGLEIEGEFTNTDGKQRAYHYVQVVTSISLPDARPPFVDGTIINPPFVDFPPGGYKGRADDWLPWYDGLSDKFPKFYDFPQFQDETFPNNQTLTVNFETWLVCLVSKSFGNKAQRADDDKYSIVPLLGWIWGYELKDVDQNDIVNVAQSALQFTWRQPKDKQLPSGLWTQGLNQTYGGPQYQGVGPDKWSIDVREKCADCEVPEPTSFALLGIGLAILGIVGKSVRNQG